MTAVLVGQCPTCGQAVMAERDHRLKTQPTEVEREPWWPPVELDHPAPPIDLGWRAFLLRYSAIYRHFQGGK